jgi:hypothetical protein
MKFLIFKRLDMKKSDITASLLIIITCILLVIFLGLRSIDIGGGVPSYRFLAGREPITCKIANRGTEDRRYVYSFEADFNDLCSKVNAELIPAGFVDNTIVGEALLGYECRIYNLNGRFPRGRVCIYIYDNRQCIKLQNSNNYAISLTDGWVMVEVAYYRGWRWPF